MCLKAEKLAKIFVNPDPKKLYVHTPDGDRKMYIYHTIHDSWATIREVDPKIIFKYWLHYEKSYNTKKELIGNLNQQSSCVFFIYIIQVYR